MLRLDESDLEGPDQGNSTCEVKLKGEKKKAISRQDVFLEIMNLLNLKLTCP